METGEPTDALSGKPWLYLLLIVAGAFALRLYHLDFQDVWYDEAFSITSSAKPIPELTQALVRDWVHPPLHSYVLHVWQILFGIGGFEARFLSVVFGTLSIVMIYLLAEYLFGFPEAILAALILAVSHLGVMYSQEARPYEQLLFLVLAAVYFFIRALRERRSYQVWLLAVSALAMLYTHYYGWIVFAVLVLFAMWYRKRYEIRLSWCVVAVCAAVGLYLPWLASGVIGEAVRSTKTTANVMNYAYLWSGISALNWFNNGKILGVQKHAPIWTFVAGFLLFTIPAVVAVRSAQKELRPLVNLLALLSVVPPALILIGSSLTDFQYFVRYLAFSIAPYYVLVARGITILRPLSARVFLTAAIVVYSAGALFSHYSISYKGEMRQALSYLASEYKEGDCVIFLSARGSNKPPLQWQVYHLPAVRTDGLDWMASDVEPCGRVWLAWRWTIWESPKQEDEQAAALVIQRKYRVIAGRNFWGADIRLFERMR